MKKILLIATGGTIACAPGDDGLVPDLDGRSLIELVPELKNLCEVGYVELMSKDSSDIRPSDWTSMAKVVANYRDAFDGFVITHGTDTMAYTSAALSYMLGNIDKPVIITGSQLPIEHPRTDAKGNIYNSFKTACDGMPGVFIVFAGSVIEGEAARKIYTGSPKAFRAVNSRAAGRITDDTVKWAPFIAESCGAECGKFKLMAKADRRVRLIKVIPGIEADIVDQAVAGGYRGIVVEGFGAGGVPLGVNSMLPAIKRAIRAGVIVVIATQCMYGGVNLDKYPNGILTKRAGALSAGNLTAETAAVKLMWALGNSKSADEAKELFMSR